MMPAGTFYIGDLCYVLSPEWDEVCGLLFEGNRPVNGEFTLKDGRRFACYTTMYGDGEYPTSTGTYVGVDAGVVGCVLVSDIRDPEADPAKDGIVVTFESPFYTRSSDGVIHFGDVAVDTSGDEGDDEDYSDE
jgi:hypothetical protein